MLGSAIAFLASPAGAAIIAAFQNWRDEKRKDRQDEAERLHQERMATGKHAAEMYSLQMREAQIKPLRYVRETRKTRFRHFLWIFRYGKPVQTVTRVERDKLSQTPRERLSGLIVFILACMYCLCCFWVALWVSQDFKIVSPEAKQAGFNLLGIVKVAWGGNKPVEQSGLSALLYMLVLPGSILAHYVVRKKQP